MGPTLLHRAAWRLGLEPLGPPGDPGDPPSPVSLTARANCALRQELRAAGFDPDSDHLFSGDARVTELHVFPRGVGVMEACRDPLRLSWWSRNGCDPEVNWADLGPTFIRRAEASLGLARVGCDLLQGVTPTVVHWAAHSNAAFWGELRGADLPAGSAPDDPDPWEE